MNDSQEQTARLCLRLVLDSLEVRAGLSTRSGDPLRVPDTEAWIARGVIGDQTLTVGVVFIVPVMGGGAWYSAKPALEDRVGRTLSGGYLLWAPSGADLPAREPGRSDFIVRVEEAATRLAPGERGEVQFPVTLYLRKSDEEGGYITARGGLAPHWARFTGRVFGHYQLDSTELHRPPSGAGYLDTLIDSIALTANSLKLGDTEAIEALDAWTIQRLSAGDGLAIIGEPPGAELSSGAALRRNLRRTMQALRGPMIAESAGARVLCFVGPYSSFKDQPVGTALLGMDPAAYGGLDLVLLAADGEVGPVLDLTRSPLLVRQEV
jgi:hypothetical protein